MLGLESTVSIGKQVSAVDPATLARQSLNIYSITGGQTEQDSEDSILGGSLQNQSDPVAPAPGLDDHRIKVRVPLCSNQFAIWCAAFFGTEAAPAGPTNYVHAWKSGQALPYVFIEHQLKNGRFRRHFGCVGEQIDVDLDAEREGYGMAELTFVGLKETVANAALTGAVTEAPTLVRPAQKLVTGLYNAVAGGDLMGGKFTFKRTLKRVRGADGTGVPYSIEIDGISSLTGSIRTRSNDDTFVADAVAKTARALELHLLANPNTGVKFAMANQRLERTPLDISGPGGVEHSFNLRGWQTGADAALVVSVLNQTATAVLP